MMTGRHQKNYRGIIMLSFPTWDCMCRCLGLQFWEVVKGITLFTVVSFAFLICCPHLQSTLLLQKLLLVDYYQPYLFGEIGRIYSPENNDTPLYTPSFFAGCKISHMMFFSIYICKQLSEIILLAHTNNLASQLSHLCFFAIAIYSFYNFTNNIYSL